LGGARKFEVQLVAVNAHDAIGKTKVTVTINQPPTAGDCSFEPLSLAAGETLSLTCSGWIDEDRLDEATDGMSGYVVSAVNTANGESQPLATLESFDPPVAIQQGSGIYSFRVVGRDKLGASTAYDVPGQAIVDLPSADVVEEVLNPAALEEAIAGGDPTEIMNLVLVSGRHEHYWPH